MCTVQLFIQEDFIQLGQDSFRRLRKVTLTCAIRLPSLGLQSMLNSSRVKVCCVDYWYGVRRKRIGRLTGRTDVTVQLFKTSLTPINLYFPKASGPVNTTA